MVHNVFMIQPVWHAARKAGNRFIIEAQNAEVRHIVEPTNQTPTNRNTGKEKKKKQMLNEAGSIAACCSIQVTKAREEVYVCSAYKPSKRKCAWQEVRSVGGYAEGKWGSILTTSTPQPCSSHPVFSVCLLSVCLLSCPVPCGKACMQKAAEQGRPHASLLFCKMPWRCSANVSCSCKMLGRQAGMRQR